MFSRTLFNVPLASYSASADDSTAPPILELVSEVENLITLVPVAQRGLVFTAAVGIKNDAPILPKRSDINLRSLTTALAPESATNTSPTCTLPKNSPTACAARSSVLIFKNAVVEAYDEGIDVSSYGLKTYKSLGAATFNTHPLISPLTVSPGMKGVEFVRASVEGSLISSINFGVI